MNIAELSDDLTDPLDSIFCILYVKTSDAIENVKIALHARIHGTDATFPAQGQAHGRNGTSAQGHEGEKAPKTFTDEERTIAMEDTNSSAGASSSADGTSQAGGSTQPLDSRPKRPSWETEVADEKEGAFVIVSNVQGEFEEAW